MGIPKKTIAHGNINYRDLILTAARDRGTEKTLCPSEVLKGADKKNKELMKEVRLAAFQLADEGRIEILQRGQLVDASKLKGPIRLRIKIKNSR